MIPNPYPAIIKSIKRMLLPEVDLDLNDLIIEKGHEKQKQNNIINSNIPMASSIFMRFPSALSCGDRPL
jgi:hypothetical protein